MTHRLCAGILFLFIFVITSGQTIAQDLNNQFFPETERLIRIAESDQIADSVNVWGAVGSSGRYLIPEGMRLPELISYSLGPRSFGGGEQSIEWTKIRLKVKISRYNREQRKVDIAMFQYRFDEPEPIDMFEYKLQNNDIVTLQVRRKPGVLDVLSAIAPFVSLTAATLLVIDRL